MPYDARAVWLVYGSRDLSSSFFLQPKPNLTVIMIPHPSHNQESKEVHHHATIMSRLLMLSQT